jgi:uncharacterized protein YjbI with pentapeptide repeats
MGARFRSWWQKNKQHVLIVGIILIAVFTAFTLAVYKFGWDWTGFGPYIPPPKDSNFQRGKTLWDLLQLAGVIAIPISDLLLSNHLRESHPDDEVRKIAEARTLTVLPRLDGKRKGNVLLFLYESGLIRRATRIIKLYGADLAEADLGGTDLSEADLSGADPSHAKLSKADLHRAYLSGADLHGAYLVHADLSFANLNGAILNGANLNGANLSYASLSEADLIGANLGKAVGTTTKQLLDEALSLKDAIMPDGSKHA